MHKPLYFLVLFDIIFVCLNGCNPSVDDVIKKKIEEFGLRDRKINKEVYEKGCKELEVIYKDEKYTKDTTMNFIEYVKKFGVFCDSTSIKMNYGPYKVNVYLENTRNMNGYLNGYTDFKRDVASLLNGIVSANEGPEHTLRHKNNKIDEEYSNGKIDSIIRELSYWDFIEKGGDSISRKFVSLNNIIGAALSKADSLSISILISDFGFARSNVPDGRGETPYIEFIKFESDKIKNSLKNRKDLSLLVLRLESVFRDCYYDVNGKCYIDSLTNETYIKECIPKERDYRYKIAMQKKCEDMEKEKNCYKNEPTDKEVMTQSIKEATKICSYSKSRTKISEPFSRPYFVWIFGTNRQIVQILKTPFFANRKEGDSLWLAKYIRNNPTQDIKKFEIISYEEIENKDSLVKYNKAKEEDSIWFDGNTTNFKNKDSKLKIPIKLNFGEMAEILQEVYENDANYKLNNHKNFSIDIEPLKNDNKWTHKIAIKSKDIAKDDKVANLISNTQFLSVNVNMEQKDKASWKWIKNYSCITDTLFVNTRKSNQTRGLDILLENVYDAFYEREHSMDSFKIKIGVKK